MTKQTMLDNGDVVWKPAAPDFLLRIVRYGEDAVMWVGAPDSDWTREDDYDRFYVMHKDRLTYEGNDRGKADLAYHEAFFAAP